MVKNTTLTMPATAAAVALEQEMAARTQEMRARVVEAEAHPEELHAVEAEVEQSGMAIE